MPADKMAESIEAFLASFEKLKQAEAHAKTDAEALECVIDARDTLHRAFESITDVDGAEWGAFDGFADDKAGAELMAATKSCADGMAEIFRWQLRKNRVSGRRGVTHVIVAADLHNTSDKLRRLLPHLR